jgi:hypothetical protein
MNQEPVSGGTPEFDEYGASLGKIQNFAASYDVAKLEVHFTLDAPAQIQFDFIFGSVEYPSWASQYTDAFLVFLDGLTPADQITFDSEGNPVQVGNSFFGLTTTADLNTAFSTPHGQIHHLTTTSPIIPSGDHVLYFELGDVNDHILDSVAFIANLRTGSGKPGTVPTQDCRTDFNQDGAITVDDIFIFLTAWFTDDPVADFDGTAGVTIDDIFIFLNAWFRGCT